MGAPRKWTDEQLRALFPALAVDAPDPVRCSAAGGGQGTYLSYRSDERRGCARVDIRAEPAETLAVCFEHEWPSDWEPSLTEALDAAILRGLVDGLLRGRASAEFGRVVTRSIVYYEGHVTAIAFTIAATMALQHAIQRGGWDPEPPTDDAIASFGRLCR